MDAHQNPSLARGREFGLGFVYWLTFLLVLEPGNLARAGGALAWEGEVARIFGASLLGASATPVLLALMRRFPIQGRLLWRHTIVHALSAGGISFGLIALSCLLAPLMNIGDSRPFLVALPDHLAANWLLLAFCIAAFTAVAHAVRFARSAEQSRRLLAQLQLNAPRPVEPARYLTQVEIRSRGRVTIVNLSEVDHIETQGNYLALHTAGATHLLRGTLTSFEANLDPDRFARIHRCALVAIDRVREITPIASGDATVRLIDGTVLRLSRNFRESVRVALARSAVPSPELKR
ncbi:MAG: LytTR family transcriptional regulator [Alphaproteobacteria bacterium]|nr:LytTR family transcriptional regulator [Alphaproteobacteria bacterium]